MMMVKNQKEGFGRVCLLGERVAGASLGPWCPAGSRVWDRWISDPPTHTMEGFSARQAGGGF